MIVLYILLLPYYVLSYFILKPLARFILRNEIKYDKELLEQTRQLKSRLHGENEQLKEDVIEFNRRLDRIKYIITQNKDKTCEISLTEKGEIVVITYDRNNVFDYIKIFGENSNHPYYDCQVALHTFGNDLKIVDFSSYRPGFGYGKTLLNFTFNKAKRSKFKRVYGDLSYMDKGGFNRLVPFYESFGFTCTLFEDTNQTIIGKIEMDLAE
ncbi:hypothetical protein KO02_00425 [Sphingobacterium sp. ML3W]|uniref:hypothetical protein n=1 Tax=Sphingobacterium sp. ML3W TaxID=1538644 RepID=UPI0004F5B6DA|nr:hypothetical protein [Sphingobacterium sp. ML3W]AIM35302.1 hypothetical protein KO02_00425 [Sphingobacterium sp. ML3W]